jgi:hypothetical protein
VGESGGYDQCGQQDDQLAVRLLAVADDLFEQESHRFVFLRQHGGVGLELPHPQAEIGPALLDFFD